MSTAIRSALVFGATSAIGTALCRRLAQQRANLHLVARSQAGLKALAADLELRGASAVSFAQADLTDTDRHEELVAGGWDCLQRPDLALLAYGSLAEQASLQTDWSLQHNLLQVNLVSQLSLLTHLANRFENQRSGCLAAISSVAGDRGRASNYCYGAAKAGLSCYLQGLGQRLALAQVRVLDLRLGRVDTPMTAAFAKGLFWTTPQRISAPIFCALTRRSGTVYLPGYWRPIMAVVRAMPAAVVRRLNF